MRTKINPIASLTAAIMLAGVTAIFAHNPNGKVDPMNASLEPLQGAEFEQSYLQQMIQHHRSEIEMAKLVSAHTKRAELQDFANKMISMQQQEIDQMTGWLKQWFNAFPMDVANAAADKEMKSHMSMLSDKRDADFDKAFLTTMPMHHHIAVEMAEQAEKKATHPEVKEFATKLAKDQKEEIKQMKSWAQSWFGPA
jgi:uncharacterized protein (DUF305 family)